jgi:hypothetical protein
MVLLRHGLAPLGLSSKAARACVIGPLLLVTGCASNKQASYVHGPGAHVAATPKVEMEDDGRPVQPPPARPINPAEDDPTQPWSPNYGRGALPPARGPSAAPARHNEASVAAPIQQVSWQPSAAPVTGALTRVDDRTADQMIAQAINAHEMRKQ